MQTYRWNNDALIEKMDVKHTVSGPEALIYPASHAAAGKLMNLPDVLRNAGMDAEIKPINRDNGGVALSVRGFDSGETVAELLEANAYVNRAARDVQMTEQAAGSGRGR